MASVQDCRTTDVIADRDYINQHVQIVNYRLGTPPVLRVGVEYGSWVCQGSVGCLSRTAEQRMLLQTGTLLTYTFRSNYLSPALGTHLIL